MKKSILVAVVVGFGAVSAFARASADPMSTDFSDLSATVKRSTAAQKKKAVRRKSAASAPKQSTSRSSEPDRCPSSDDAADVPALPKFRCDNAPQGPQPQIVGEAPGTFPARALRGTYDLFKSDGSNADMILWVDVLHNVPRFVWRYNYQLPVVHFVDGPEWDGTGLLLGSTPFGDGTASGVVFNGVSGRLLDDGRIKVYFVRPCGLDGPYFGVKKKDPTLAALDIPPDASSDAESFKITDICSADNGIAGSYVGEIRSLSPDPDDARENRLLRCVDGRPSRPPENSLLKVRMNLTCISPGRVAMHIWENGDSNQGHIWYTLTFGTLSDKDGTLVISQFPLGRSDARTVVSAAQTAYVRLNVSDLRRHRLRGIFMNANKIQPDLLSGDQDESFPAMQWPPDPSPPSPKDQ